MQQLITSKNVILVLKWQICVIFLFISPHNKRLERHFVVLSCDTLFPNTHLACKSGNFHDVTDFGFQMAAHRLQHLH